MAEGLAVGGRGAFDGEVFADGRLRDPQGGRDPLPRVALLAQPGDFALSQLDALALAGGDAVGAFEYVDPEP